MHKLLVFMFSGQGAHYFHMGRIVYDTHPVFRAWLQQGAKQIDRQIGTQILDILYDEHKRKSDPFDRTLYTHPALFIVQHALAQTLMAEGIYPDALVGASLGELVAAVIAKIITFEEGLFIALAQARYIEQYCLPGGMLAILNDKNIYYQQPPLNQRCVLAGDNFPGHFTLAGGADDVLMAMQWLSQQAITHQRLPISHGFHSTSIDAAQDAISQALSQVNFQTAHIPFYSCATAMQHDQIVKQHLWNAIRETIVFRQTLQTIEQTKGPCSYIDLSPTGTLATFVKYNLAPDSASQVFKSLSPYQPEEQWLSHLRKVLS